MTTNTAQEVIKKAYVDAGKLPRGGVPTPAQYIDALERLNDLINLWQTQGLKLWLETETTIMLAAGQQLYSFYPGGDIAITRPLRVKQAAYWDAHGNNRPLVPIAREEWTRLSNRLAQGSVNQYFVEKLADRLNVYLWHIPDTVAAAGTVKVVLHNQATDPAIISEGTSFPPEWVLALRWGLADDLATGMPEPIIQRCQLRATAYRQALEDWDVEDAPTYFIPDHRMLTPNRFA